MARLIIIRDSEYINRLRAYGIYVDGVKIGNVSNGDSQEFVIPPGQHQVYAKIDWCTSPTMSFNVKDTEAKTYQIGTFKHAKWIIPVSIAILIVHFFLSFTIHFSYAIYLLVPFFLIQVYYMTIAHNRYLSIREF